MQAFGIVRDRHLRVSREPQQRPDLVVVAQSGIALHVPQVQLAGLDGQA